MTREQFLNIVRPYTMTSEERINCLFDSLEYIKTEKIAGDFVECGVWKGGNILGIAEFLKNNNMLENKIWLYDTFNGMTQPKEIDQDFQGQFASKIYNDVICFSPIEEVKQNLSLSSYPKEKINFIVGDVCETLLDKKNLPSKISLLRLDTDWYESTKIELEILYDKLSNNGVLIIDDYGHWNGCRKAVDDFFKDKQVIFNKVDYTCIQIIKTEEKK